MAWSFVLQLHGLYIGFLLVAAVVMYRIYMKLIFRQDLMEAYMAVSYTHLQYFLQCA